MALFKLVPNKTKYVDETTKFFLDYYIFLNKLILSKLGVIIFRNTY